MTHIKKDTLYNLQIPLLPIIEQRNIVNFYQTNTNNINDLQRQINEL